MEFADAKLALRHGSVAEVGLNPNFVGVAPVFRLPTAPYSCVIPAKAGIQIRQPEVSGSGCPPIT